jgi:non-specific protein-tyrosine kinase
MFSDQALIQTYEEVLIGRPVLEAAIAASALELDPEDLVQQVTVTPVRSTQLVRLGVKNSDANLATQIANSIAETFVMQIQSLKKEPFKINLASIQENMDSLAGKIEEKEGDVSESTLEIVRVDAELTFLQNLLNEQRTDYQVIQQDLEQVDITAANEGDSIVVVEPAQTPQNPVQNRLLYTILAAAVGAMIAIGTAFLLEYLNDTISKAEDIRGMAGANLLGSIGHLSNGEHELVVFAEPRSEIAESFRVLATNLRFASVDKPLRTLLVTSPHPKEGKSLVAANLAAALAQKELRVVLVDADLRLPRLHELFGFPRSKGLSNALLSGNIDGNLQPTQVVQLQVLSGGHKPPNPTELVSSSRMRKMLAELSQEADLVVIDSPPVLPVADAATLAAAVDGVLLVLRAGQIRGQDARQAIERLRQVQANLLGVVLNDLPTHGDSYYHYRYHADDRSLEKDWQETTLKARLEQLFTKLTQKFFLPR